MLLLLSALSAMLCCLDLYCTMSLLWYSIWYLGPRAAKHVRRGLLNHCGAKVYYARRVFGTTYELSCLSSVMNGGAVPESLA